MASGSSNNGSNRTEIELDLPDRPSAESSPSSFIRINALQSYFRRMAAVAGILVFLGNDGCSTQNKTAEALAAEQEIARKKTVEYRKKRDRLNEMAKEKIADLLKKSLQMKIDEYEEQLKMPLKERNSSLGINEHYLEILTYPQDEKIIRMIFESLLRKGMPYDKSKKPAILMDDAHPFHLTSIALAKGIPLNFSFTLSSKESEKLGQTKMTLGELINYEKQNLFTNFPIGKSDSVGDYTLSEDEFLLDLLNTEGVTDPQTVIGKNLLGLKITRKDVVNSVRAELQNGRIADISRAGSWGISRFYDNEPKMLTPNDNTCKGIHDADALLGDGNSSMEEKMEIAGKIYANIWQEYQIVRRKKFEQGSTEAEKQEILAKEIFILGHAIELFSKHKKFFTEKQLELLEKMNDDVSPAVERVELNKDFPDTFLTHLHHALELNSVKANHEK